MTHEQNEQLHNYEFETVQKRFNDFVEAHILDNEEDKNSGISLWNIEDSSQLISVDSVKFASCKNDGNDVDFDWEHSIVLSTDSLGTPHSGLILSSYSGGEWGNDRNFVSYDLGSGEDATVRPDEVNRFLDVLEGFEEAGNLHPLSTTLEG